MNKVIITCIVLWQIITIILIGGGIYVDLFGLLGIPWNSTGLLNIFGTIVGFILIEIPALVLVSWLLMRRNARTT